MEQTVCDENITPLQSGCQEQVAFSLCFFTRVPYGNVPKNPHRLQSVPLSTS